LILKKWKKIFNYAMAIGCLRALHEGKIALPERVNIMGVNDFSVAVSPKLFSIKG